MNDHVSMMQELMENQQILKFLVVLMLSLTFEGIIVIVMMFVIRRIAHDMFRGYNQALNGITRWIDAHEKLRSDPRNHFEKEPSE